jgi:hypothetical protein
MTRLALGFIGLLMLAGCGVCKQDSNFGFYYCGPLIVP